MESTDSSGGPPPPQPNLPPGFRFHPTDEELVVHYLKRKAASAPLPVSIIAEIDLYKFDPWELPAKALFGEQEWYFFSPRDRKYPNGARPNRAATSGYWKATGTDKPVLASDGNQKVGVKKALVFYSGKPPKGVKSDWIMHEYRLIENKPNNRPPGCDFGNKKNSLRLDDDWVLCRIYKKNNASRHVDNDKDHDMIDYIFRKIPPSLSMAAATGLHHHHHHHNNVSRSMNFFPGKYSGGYGIFSDGGNTSLYDDILCSYNDYNNQDASNASNSDPAIAATNSNMEFHKTRMARSSVFPTSSYSPPEDSLSQDLTATIERTMKKYADNMMRFLEGISSRLSQLELYCYNLDKTIGEMRSDLSRENEEADVKLRYLDKHLQEVHRSVQILRDKQELADTQKELAKLQLVQKESSSSSHSQHGEERAATPVPESKKNENTSDAHNQQLALALPHQIAPQPPPQQQQQQYYMPPPTQLQNTPAPAPVPVPPSQPQAPPAQGQYIPPPPAPSHPSSAQTQSFSQYQQNWPPQPQARPPSSGAYPTYSPAPPSNQSPVESLPSSMQMQSPYSGPPQQSMQHYGYGAPPQAPQQTKMSYSPQTGDGYLPSGPPPPSGYANAMYEGGRMQYPPPQPPPQQQAHYLQGPQGGGYAPHQAGDSSTGAPPVLRSKYGELIEKLVSMGFRGDHVMTVIQRMEESGQPIDFNALLDRLSVQSSGGPPRGGW